MNIQNAKEIIKCENDFSHFCENYINIIHPEDVFVSLKLYDFQKELVSFLETNSLVIGVKDRQVGFTTACLFYSLWKSLFSNVNVLHLGENSFDILEFAIDFMPNLFKSKIKKHKNHIIVNNSSISIQNLIKPPDIVFVQEACKIRDLKIKLEELKAKKYYVFSTLEDENTWFYRTYMNAEKNGFKIFFCS